MTKKKRRQQTTLHKLSKLPKSQQRDIWRMLRHVIDGVSSQISAARHLSSAAPKRDVLD